MSKWWQNFHGHINLRFCMQSGISVNSAFWWRNPKWHCPLSVSSHQLCLILSHSGDRSAAVCQMIPFIGRMSQRILISCLMESLIKSRLLLSTASLVINQAAVLKGQLMLDLGLNAHIFYYSSSQGHLLKNRWGFVENGKPCGPDITKWTLAHVYRHELRDVSDCSASCDWNKIRMQQYWLFVIRGGH